MIWAASTGDLRAIRRLVARGVALGVPDYDARTPLHLASAEGHLEVVQYLLAQGVDPSCLDRWGHTPADDARRHGKKSVVEAFEGRGVKPRDGKEQAGSNKNPPVSQPA